MGHITVSVEKGAKTASGQAYTCTVSVNKSSYYGMSVTTRPLGVVNHEGTCLNYIGWPKASSWKPAWGSPDWRLSNNQTISSKYGTAQGMLLQNFTYTFSGTVNINRGNSRKGTATVSMGVRSTYSGSAKFAETLVEETFETTEIPKCNFTTSSLICSVDSADTEGTRYIRLSANFTNSDNYYTAKLYNNNGTELASSGANATSISHTIAVTEAMYQTKPKYYAILWGKDGQQYGKIYSPDIYVEPSGAGVTVKNSGIHGVSKLNFKNVNNKEIKEVWIKVNNKIYKTKK